jgi:hypothetical protein
LTNRLFYFNKKFLNVINTITNHRNFITYINVLKKLITILKNVKLNTIRNYNKEDYYFYILILEIKERKADKTLKHSKALNEFNTLENDPLFFYKFVLNISIIIFKDV